MNTSDYRRFGGISRLFGQKGFEKLQKSHVTVVGVGGVGSWAAEALVRTAVGSITIIDGDRVAESNCNRQLPAMDGCFGLKKVDVLRERFLRINPALNVRAIGEFVCESNFDQLLDSTDLVLDCIDSLSAKAALIDYLRQKNIPVFTSGGAGGKMDPSRITCADLAQAHGDPLLGALRSRLRKEYGFPKGIGKKPEPFGVMAVYSSEAVLPSQDGAEGFGVFMPVTASFGMVLAKNAILSLLSTEEKS